MPDGIAGGWEVEAYAEANEAWAEWLYVEVETENGGVARLFADGSWAVWG